MDCLNFSLRMAFLTCSKCSASLSRTRFNSALYLSLEPRETCSSWLPASRKVLRISASTSLSEAEIPKLRADWDMISFSTSVSTAAMTSDRRSIRPPRSSTVACLALRSFNTSPRVYSTSPIRTTSWLCGRTSSMA